ncbi:hypothetical protein QVD17_10111 [Tagetes erecta]|uniref:DRBM domain-containing protein n=1 Tax=Tagetes erecta TaxID=13708 RepID=A0AAD8P4I4_TARER|nr:hypothetical protein QVD17_10111 [Tagetes erecta]
METLLPAQPLPKNYQSIGLTSIPASQPPPENAHCSSHPIAAGSKPHMLYKCLLIQLTQKLKKQPPLYRTQNEGSDHIPRFRSTVCVDGVSYTSSSTFKQRKMSEMDVSKVAYIAVTEKAKTDALHFIQEDKISCKAIMAEFAAKKNVRRPIYETAQLEAAIPVFRSNMLFNGVSYVGDNGKNKKESEQLVARSVIIKYLDSEYGLDMAIIVNCKLRQCHEMNKVQEINSVLQAQAGVGHNFAVTESRTNIIAESSAASESSLVQGTLVPATVTPQPIIPQLSVQPITPAAPVVIQPPTQQLSTGPINPAVPLVIQPPTPQVSTEPINPAAYVVTQPPTSQISVEPIKEVVEPLGLTPVPCPVVNYSSSPVVLVPKVESQATNLSSNVIQQPKTEPSPAQAPEYIPLMGETSNRKRSKKNKKNARKKMRPDAQMPVEPANQVLPLSSPQ